MNSYDAELGVNLHILEKNGLISCDRSFTVINNINCTLPDHFFTGGNFPSRYIFYSLTMEAVNPYLECVTKGHRPGLKMSGLFYTASMVGINDPLLFLGLVWQT